MRWSKGDSTAKEGEWFTSSQGLTLVHCLAQPEPFLTQNTF